MSWQDAALDSYYVLIEVMCTVAILMHNNTLGPFILQLLIDTSFRIHYQFSGRAAPLINRNFHIVFSF